MHVKKKVNTQKKQKQKKNDPQLCHLQLKPHPSIQQSLSPVMAVTARERQHQEEA